MKAEAAKPLVSVVIAARGSQEELVRAVKSALNQTFQSIEVILVLNPSFFHEQKIFAAFQDSRLVIKVLTQATEIGAMWNAGVESAQSQWIALLDSRDEWLPQKLALQFCAASAAQSLYPIVSCRLTGRRKDADFLWPRRYPKTGEPISDYLFCRKSPFYGEGLIKPSTLFTCKELLQKIPFREDLKQHEDYDWLLRAAAFKGVSIQFVSEEKPLLVWNIDDDFSGSDLEGTLLWMRENQSLFTPQSYASFLLIGFSHEMAALRDWKIFFQLLKEAFLNGRPGIFDVFLHLGYWTIPLRLQCASAFKYQSSAKAPK